MYFKCQDVDQNWYWFSDVIDLSKINTAELNGQKTELIGKLSVNDTPHLIRIKTTHEGTRYLCIYGTRGYLCNEHNGTTLDTVF